MSTYVTKRGSLYEAIEATRSQHCMECPVAPGVLALGEQCKPDFIEMLAELGVCYTERARTATFMGLRIKWVPGNDIMVGNFVSLQ